MKYLLLALALILCGGCKGQEVTPPQPTRMDTVSVVVMEGGDKLDWDWEWRFDSRCNAYVVIIPVDPPIKVRVLKQ